MHKAFVVTLSLCTLVTFAAMAAQHVVTQSDKKFSTTELTVKVGDSVEFKNTDKVSHNVMSASKGNSFNLGAQAPGESTSQTFDTAGKVEVTCAIHPKMKTTINVVE